MGSVKEIACKSALHYHNIKWLPYKYDINVYRGCSHRCIYCYALYSHDYIDGGSFYNDIYAKTNIADVLGRELAAFPRQTVNLGGVCDSYQSAERDCKIMPRVLIVLTPLFLFYFIMLFEETDAFILFLFRRLRC